MLVDALRIRRTQHPLGRDGQIPFGLNDAPFAVKAFIENDFRFCTVAIGR